MPAISSNRITQAIPCDAASISREACGQLEQLLSDLEGEVCNALLEENVKLAERLVLRQAQVRKLRLLLSGLKG